MKFLPTGISDFTQLIDKKRYFVDKTRYIEKISSFAKDYLYFVRPRRFGKSLFLSMLGTYFDVYMKDSFDLYFKDTWIHTHPTDDQGAYQVIRLDFSKVSGDISCAEGDFNQSVGLEILLCARKYQKFYDQDFLDRLSGIDTAKNRLDYYCSEAAIRGYRLYLLVDEYDNFTNTILLGNGRDRYDEITHSDGFLRSFFKVVKTGFDRIFLADISPLIMNALTSGSSLDVRIMGSCA